jgi:large subunit ribosomal protein L20
MTREDKIMALARGMRGRAKNCYRLALRRVEKGLQYAYRGRKLKKRTARKEWITQVAAGCREHGLVYSKLIHGMTLAQIGVNRKMMALLAQQEPYSFRAIIEEAKTSLKSAVLRGAGSPTTEPTVVPDAQASSQVERGHVPKYDGPPLQPYPRRYKHFS